jgi:hypothetical protein
MCTVGHYLGIITPTSTDPIQTTTCYAQGDCPIGSFDDASTTVCTLCNIACQSCSVNSTNCPTCMPSYYHDFYIDFCYPNGSCLNGNPAAVGQVVVSGNQTCQLCHPRCASCTAVNDYTACSMCTNNFYLGIITHNSTDPIQLTTCYDAGSCPTGSFDQSGQIVCTICDSNCYNCSINSSNCFYCIEPSFRDNYTNVCYITGNSCPNGDPTKTGQVPVSGYQICELCDARCATCTLPNDYTACSMCTNGYYQGINTTSMAADIITTTCYSSGNCPIGSFNEMGKIVCTACNFAC